ncbi:unnamed protein product [Lathyrus sativus]|nr:unnamed protein product [Lathyrus sativus]
MRLDSWRFLVDKVKRRLNSWSSRQLSLGGRVILIYSTLNSIPIFSLSFYRILIRIKKELKFVYQNFLWGGIELKTKVHWLNWRLICSKKDKGGLRVKDIDLFNKALLSKWKWRFLVEDNYIWFELIKFKYGKFACDFMGDAFFDRRIKGSVWWRDLRKVDLDKVNNFSCLAGNIQCSVGNRNKIPFWQAIWLEDQSLLNRFSKVFQAAFMKECEIDVGEWIEDCWVWNLEKILLVNGSNISSSVSDLKDVLSNCSPSLVLAQNFCWKPDPSKIYSVHSCYNQLLFLSAGSTILDSSEVEALSKVWRNKIPSKIKFF